LWSAADYHRGVRHVAVITLLLACNSSSAAPADAESAVRAWVPDGIKGELSLASLSCKHATSERFRCRAEVAGGGAVQIDATKSGASWTIALGEPIVVSSLLEGQIVDHLAKMELKAVAKCGDRVHPSVPGQKFQCAVEDDAGKVVNAVEVSIKDGQGNVGWKLVTGIIASDDLEKRIDAWLVEQQVTGRSSCGQRNRFSAPDLRFDCSIDGDPRPVLVQVSDYRGTLSWGFAP
jgi:hypothetical protein